MLKAFKFWKFSGWNWDYSSWSEEDDVESFETVDMKIEECLGNKSRKLQKKRHSKIYTES